MGCVTRQESLLLQKPDVFLQRDAGPGVFGAEWFPDAIKERAKFRFKSQAGRIIGKQRVATSKHTTEKSGGVHLAIGHTKALCFQTPKPISRAVQLLQKAAPDCRDPILIRRVPGNEPRTVRRAKAEPPAQGHKVDVGHQAAVQGDAIFWPLLPETAKVQFAFEDVTSSLNLRVRSVRVGSAIWRTRTFQARRGCRTASQPPGG